MSTLPPGARHSFGTGISVAIPTGYVGLVVPRSGLALASGVTVINAPGTIDSGYRGEVKVLLANLDPSRSHRIRKGDRIAQLLIQPVVTASFRVARVLPRSVRGARGLGSTGR
jgi:dUTP pyrophosphatase